MKKKLVTAPIDGKNLAEDPFEDEVFGNFYACEDHLKNRKRHLIGFEGEAYVEVSWEYGSYQVKIKVIAVNPCENYDEVRKEIYEHYKKEFSSWQCEDNDIIVKFSETSTHLLVSFFFETD